MPTPHNTGPTEAPTATMTAEQFKRSRTCEDRRIIDHIRMDTNGLGAYAGAEFTLTNCVVEQGWIWNEESTAYPASQYPEIDMRSTTVNGSFAWALAFRGTWDDVKVTNGWQLAACGSCAGPDFGVIRELPFTVRNSYIATPPIPASTGCRHHSEAFHGIGGAGGYTFINTRFVQEGGSGGPRAFCHTGAIYQQGGGGVTYDHCYFDDGDADSRTGTYYYTVNIDGTGPRAARNLVKNSFIEKGAATYAANPSGGVAATYTDNFDFNTKEPIPDS